jgi:hypothetical protein
VTFDLASTERAMDALAAAGRAAPFMRAGQGAASVPGLRAVASTRAGEVYDGDRENVEAFVLAPAEATGGYRDSQAPRMLVCATQGNEKGTSTAVAGAIAILEIARAARDGTSATVALSRAGKHIADLAKRAPPVPRGRFHAAAVGEVSTLRGIGTSAIALELSGASATVAHLGECTAFLVRDGEARCIARPHTLGRLAEQGGDEALRAYLKREPSSADVVTEVLGGKAEPEIATLDARPSDTFILCTSRAGRLALGQIAASVVPDPAEALRQILAAVPDAYNESVGVTVIVACVGGFSSR